MGLDTPTKPERGCFSFRDSVRAIPSQKAFQIRTFHSFVQMPESQKPKMDTIKKLKSQRNWLLLAAFPFLPFFVLIALLQRSQKNRMRAFSLATFARFHGRSPQQISAWLGEFRSDLTTRLQAGKLQEMAAAAQQIEPLIPTFSDSIPVMCHPLSSRDFLHMINGILELQERVDFKRFDTVVVTSAAADPSELRAVISEVEQQDSRLLVINTSRNGDVATQCETLSVFSASRHMSLLKDADCQRVLLEYVRSLHPVRVVVADSEMMSDVVSLYGAALAATSEVWAFHSAQRDNQFTQRYFYRHFDLFSGVYVSDEPARKALVARFMLCEDAADRLAVLGEPRETKRVTPNLLPAIGGTDDGPCDVDDHLDISLIMTAHNETTVTGMTMISANASVAAAEAEGYKVEKIIVLDAATEKTRACLSNPAYADWSVIEIAERDLGRARNRIVRMARGKYIAFLDADDLFSENWLLGGAALLDAAASVGENVIAHPEVNWFFDGDRSLLAVTPQDSPVFSPALFYFTNYYDSLCMAPRQAHLDLPYVSRDVRNGLSYQDHQFAVETLAAGWHHKIAPDTIVFKRRRDSSLVTESSGKNSVIRQITPLAIDNIPALIGFKRETGKN